MLEKSVENTLDSNKSNNSILNEIQPYFLLVILTRNLKLRYFGCVMHRQESSEKSLRLEKS